MKFIDVSIIQSIKSNNDDVKQPEKKRSVITSNIENNISIQPTSRREKNVVVSTNNHVNILPTKILTNRQIKNMNNINISPAKSNNKWIKHNHNIHISPVKPKPPKRRPLKLIKNNEISIQPIHEINMQKTIRLNNNHTDAKENKTKDDILSMNYFESS
eukprot:UN33525